MKRRRFAIIGVLLALVVPGAIVWSIVDGFVGRTKLIDHHGIAAGQIYGCTKGVKGSPAACNVRYRFTVNDKEYQGVTLFRPPVLSYEDCMAHLQGRTFPVGYETGNEENSVLLLSQASSQVYKYSFPDSLNWVAQYVHEK